MRFRTAFILFSMLLPSLGAAETPTACEALLQEDQALIAALPERLRVLMDSAKVKRLVVGGETRWQEFFQAMDAGLEKPGTLIESRIGNISMETVITSASSKNAQMAVGFIWHDEVPLGETISRGDEFLEVLTAQVAWVARARAAGKIKNIEIIGHDLKNSRLVSLLDSFGFRQALPGKRACLGAGLAGAGVGLGAGYLYFYLSEKEDAEEEPIGSEDQKRKYIKAVIGTPIVAGLLTAGIFCFSPRGNDYSFKLKPKKE